MYVVQNLVFEMMNLLRLSWGALGQALALRPPDEGARAARLAPDPGRRFLLWLLLRFRSHMVHRYAIQQSRLVRLQVAFEFSFALLCMHAMHVQARERVATAL